MHFSAPGKLFISGEWSILHMGNQGIVAAVNKRVHSDLSDNDDSISITIDDFNIKDLKCRFDSKELIFSENIDEIKENIQFIKGSIETALKFLKENNIEPKPFKIHTWGEETSIVVDGEQKKVGFGSSAASVVAVIASVLAFHDYEATKEEIYKLSTIAHYFTQGKVGSAFDVAASTYGGLFVYKRFDADWLVKQIEEGNLIKDIIASEWLGFYVEELDVPDDFILVIGWTKESASTSAMVKQMKEYEKQEPEMYKKLMNNVASIAAKAVQAFKSNNREEFLKLLQENEKALAELGKASGVKIETPDLKTMSELANKYGAGKLSGAGGGDCGIGICFDKESSEKIKKDWENAGFYVVDATIDREGVKQI